MSRIKDQPVDDKHIVVNAMTIACLEIMVKGMNHQGIGSIGIMVVLESLAAGVIVALAKEGREVGMVEKFAAGLVLRVKQDSLGNTPAQGNG